MGKPFRLLLLTAAGAAIVFATLMIVNQTAQIVGLASAIHPAAGQALLYTLLVLYGTIVLIPLIAYLRLDKPLIHPGEEASEAELVQYRRRQRRRLERNQLLRDKLEDWADLTDGEFVKAAHQMLDQRADEEAKEAASAVFLVTAVSQSGRLDGLAVLAAQVRLVWRIARLYHQRPGLREWIYLYGNVAAATWAAVELDDLDMLEEQLEPVMGAVLSGTAGSLVPGMQTAAAVITQSLLEGSANALLTLRTGMLAKRYCGGAERRTAKLHRHAASAEAAVLLGGMLGMLAGKVGGRMLRASARAMKKAGRQWKDASLDKASAVLEETKALADRTTRSTWELTRKAVGRGLLARIRGFKGW